MQFCLKSGWENMLWYTSGSQSDISLPSNNEDGALWTYFMTLTTLNYSIVSVNSHQVNGLMPQPANMQYILHSVAGEDKTWVLHWTIFREF